MTGGLFGNPTLDAPSPVAVLTAHRACRYPASVDTTNRPPRTGIMFTGRLPTDCVFVGWAASGSMPRPVTSGAGWLAGGADCRPAGWSAAAHPNPHASAP